MCEKCKHYTGNHGGVIWYKNICVHCKELFPWLTESKFKEKKHEKN